MQSKFDSTTWTYTYDANGMRTKRTNGTTTYTYVYNGGQLTQMTKGNDTLYFTYGATGPATVTWNGVVYYYVTNIQGDVVAIMNAAGAPVVQYIYDAWGALLSYSGTMRNTLGALNPLRYRGYLYDSETQLYYLNSRYYSPRLCRFINADAFASTGQGMLGNNMFAYCNNNPICFVDPFGYHPPSQFAYVCTVDGVGGKSINNTPSTPSDTSVLHEMYDSITAVQQQQLITQNKILQTQLQLIQDGLKIIWDAYMREYAMQEQTQRQQAEATIYRFSTPELREETLLVIASEFSLINAIASGNPCAIIPTAINFYYRIKSLCNEGG